MQYVPTPNRGADVSATGFEAGGPLLSGGAYQINSFDSAKNFIFEWPPSSSREAAQRMKSYADGSFGRGLIYFVDPLTWNTNILPPRWADPSMAVGDESATLIPGVVPTGTPSTAPVEANLPVKSAVYDLTQTGPTDPTRLDDSNSVFIPIPEGAYLLLGAFYNVVGSGGIYYSPVQVGGAVGTPSVIPPSNPIPTGPLGIVTAAATLQPGQVGVRIWMGRTNNTAGVITANGIVARLSPIENFSAPNDSTHKPWMGGQGNSGCRFIGKPTYMNNTGVNGGQVSYAATFREVGSWVVS